MDTITGNDINPFNTKQNMVQLVILLYLPTVYYISFLENNNNGLSPCLPLFFYFSSVKDIPIKPNLQPAGLEPLAVGQPGLTAGEVHHTTVLDATGWFAKATHRQ